MPHKIKIREAAITDAPTLAGIVRDSFQTVADRFGLNRENCSKHPSHCTPDWIQADFNRGVRYFLLGIDDRNVGCAALEKADPELCYLERLAVLPEERRGGLGARLVDHIFQEARILGCQRISIGIIAQQQELKNWYAGRGFKEGITKSFDHLPFDVTFMELDLAG